MRVDEASSAAAVVAAALASSSSSADTRQRPMTTQDPDRFLRLQSGHVDSSPLRQALASQTPPPPSTTTTTLTPLLTASLNSPPVAHTSSSSSCGSSNSKANTNNGSVDLSLQGLKRRQPCLSPPTVASSSSDDANNNNNKHMYTNLLLQLRQQSTIATTAAPSKATTTSSSSSGSTAAAARKEKLLSQSCFQCPVCQKRFQRHIAMNAHFQNEHVGQAQSSEKICRLCSHRAKSISGMRTHLLKEHGIDLDKPGACLVNNNDELSLPADISSSSSSPVNVKQEHDNEMSPSESVEARDLSLRQELVFHDRSGSVVITKRPASPAISITKRKRQQQQEEQQQEVLWKCSDCTIVFPNQTLYFLHRGFHSDSNPWRCNGCGQVCRDMYDFNTHLVSVSHC